MTNIVIVLLAIIVLLSIALVLVSTYAYKEHLNREKFEKLYEREISVKSLLYTDWD